MKLNQILKANRIKNKLTQEQLAQKIHVSHQTISKWEQGINVPSIDNLLILSDLYNISLDELIRGSQFFRKPFMIGKKVALNKIILFLVVWAFVSLLLTGFGYQPFWLTLLLFFGGVICVFPLTIENYWIIEKSGIAFQIYPTTMSVKLTAIAQAILHSDSAGPLIPYSEISQLELIYQKRKRLSPFDLSPDYFFVRLTLVSGQSYDLPITPPFLTYLPQAFSYIQSRGVTVTDDHKILTALLENQNIFDYQHTD